MSQRPKTEYIHEGRLVVCVAVTEIEPDSEWSPYYSIKDVRRLQSARDALRRGDLKAAGRLGSVYALTPVAAE